MNKTRMVLAIAVACAMVARVHSAEDVPELPPYPLPTAVQDTLTALANDCDVLILGETHGTKEVPAIVEALLEPLTTSGYRALALEVPRDEESAIDAWARGKTDVIPKFFAKPCVDGRGNREVPALVRRALRSPYAWKLICFDEAEAEMRRQVMALQLKNAKGTATEVPAKLTSDDMVALSRQRDASMASYLGTVRNKLPPEDKILAICGNFHARTANHTLPESPLAAYWPSFAAKLMHTIRSYASAR
jgi:erythromycin esterase-like protein